MKQVVYRPVCLISDTQLSGKRNLWQMTTYLKSRHPHFYLLLSHKLTQNLWCSRFWDLFDQSFDFDSLSTWISTLTSVDWWKNSKEANCCLLPLSRKCSNLTLVFQLTIAQIWKYLKVKLPVFRLTGLTCEFRFSLNTHKPEGSP